MKYNRFVLCFRFVKEKAYARLSPPSRPPSEILNPTYNLNDTYRFGEIALGNGSAKDYTKVLGAGAANVARHLIG